MVENSSFKRTYSLLTSVYLVSGWSPTPDNNEGVCVSSAVGFVFRQTLVSPFIHDVEEYDAEGHGR